MKPIANYEATEAKGESKRITPDGYVCRIKSVTDHPDKEYLYIEFDIAEGEFKDYYLEGMEKLGFWGGRFYRYYSDNALKYFKAFITSIERSNSGFKWDWGEQKLVGKYFGAVLREEEYEKKDGSIGTRVVVDYTTDVDRIRSGKFEVRPKKVLEGTVASKPAFAEIDDLDGKLPF